MILKVIIMISYITSKMKKKVVYIITKSDVGGAQKYVNDLAKNLDKNQFETKILYGGPVRDEDKLRALAISNGIKLKWLSNKIYPWLLFGNDWLAVFELVKIYKKEQPDIIHLNSSKAGVIGSLAASIYKTPHPKPHTLNPKVIFTAHGWVFNPTNALSWPVRWFYVFLHKFAALFQDKIICVSEYDYKLAVRYGIAPKEKLVTVHNGIDPNIKFFNKAEARKEIIKKLNPQSTTHNLQPDLPWIGSIGRLVKEKNYETLIRAAALITKEQRNRETEKPVFIIIGEGPEREKLKSVSRRIKADLFFIEPTGEDYKYLKAFDVFVMSSVKEGLPYTLLEAMAAGLPIVVTETGGIPEIIKDHENGLMVSQKSPEQLAGAIRGLIANSNEAKRIGEEAKKAVKEKFEITKMISETEDVYKENL